MELPAGLTDCNVEIFEKDGRAYAIYNGETMPFHKLPNDIYNAFFEEMLNNIEAVRALDALADKSFSSKFNQYLICRYGSLDSRPDFNNTTKEFTSEYYDCGKHNDCPFKFALCGQVKINDVHLTRKEIQLVILIASGLTDKETADKANITKDTLFCHKKHIYTKLNIHSNTQLTAIAYKNNLIK